VAETTPIPSHKTRYCLCLTNYYWNADYWSVFGGSIQRLDVSQYILDEMDRLQFFLLNDEWLHPLYARLQNNRSPKPFVVSIKKRGEDIELTHREFELFHYLSKHMGQVMTREHLLQTVWGYDYFGDVRTIHDVLIQYPHHVF
jgi:hypothetical protein